MTREIIFQQSEVELLFSKIEPLEAELIRVNTHIQSFSPEDIITDLTNIDAILHTSGSPETMSKFIDFIKKLQATNELDTIKQKLSEHKRSLLKPDQKTIDEIKSYCERLSEYLRQVSAIVDLVLISNKNVISAYREHAAQEIAFLNLDKLTDLEDKGFVS